MGLAIFSVSILTETLALVLRMSRIDFELRRVIFSAYYVNYKYINLD